MKKILLFVTILIMAQWATAQQIAPFKRGDRVTMVGNSITDGGHYHSYIWLYYMTRFPYDELRIYNCGVGGDAAADIYKRLDGDVFAKNPTVLTLTFGMNDSGYYEYNGKDPEKFADKKVSESNENYKLIEKRLESLPDTRIVMIGTSPYDQTVKMKDNTAFRKKNDAICRIIDFQKQSAINHKWEFLDFNAPMVAINAEKQKTDSTFTLCGSDRIHPDNDGHMVMAYLFLRAQGFAGKEVADININARKASIIHAGNCEISKLSANKREISFDYLANALPYPLDTIAHGWGFKKAQAEVVKSVPFMEEMNKEMLTISGLNGNYELTIDKEVIGTFSGSQLAKGINLAEYRNTPQYQQALAVMCLNEDRWEIERKFRDLAWLQFGFFQKKGLLFADNQKAVKVYQEGSKTDGWVRSRADLYEKAIHKEVRDAWNEEMDMLVSKIYKINKPVVRTFTLRLIK
jgi:lysophospholipase L1-like esterase